MRLVRKLHVTSKIETEMNNQIIHSCSLGSKDQINGLESQNHLYSKRLNNRFEEAFSAECSNKFHNI